MKMNTLKLIARNLLLTAALCLLGTTVIDAQIPGTLGKNRGDVVTIDGRDWYVVRYSGDAVFLLLRNPIDQAQDFGASTDYNTSRLRNRINTWYANASMPTIKANAYLANLGNHSSTTDRTTPGSLAGSATVDVAFALSGQDLVDFNAGRGLGVSPLVPEFQAYGNPSRIWGRTVGQSGGLWATLYQPTAGNHIQNGLHFLSTSAGVMSVPGIWVRAGGNNVTISGTISGLSPNSGRTIYYTVNGGTQQSVTTDASGNYSFSVPSGSNVVITPGSVTGYSVAPTNYTLNNVTSNTSGNNFAYTLNNYNLTGQVTGLSPNSGRTIYYTVNGGAQQSVTTDASGNYTISAPYGSNVVITPPTVSGYSVSPSSHTVSPVPVGGQSGLNFAYTTLSYTISGTVSGLPNNSGIPVYYTINGGAQQSVSSTSGGAYTISNVPYGANVVITASTQTGYTGSVSPTPSTSNVTSDITGKNITYAAITHTVSGRLIGLPNGQRTITYSINGGAPQTVTTDVNGNYTITGIPHNANLNIVPPTVTGYVTPIAHDLYSITNSHSNINFNYSASNFTLSGQLIGLPSGQRTVTYTIDGGAPQTVTTDVSGNYSITAPYGSAVVITPPAVTDYTVSPPSRSLTVSGDQSGLNFTYQQIYFTVNGSNYLDVNGKLFCDNQFTFVAFPNTLPDLRWYVNNVLIPGSNNQSTVNWTAPGDGTYTIRMATSASGDLFETTFKIGIESLIWTPEGNSNVAERHNWNDPENWTPKIVPTKCYNVYIPGISSHYPRLTGNSYCNDIYFIQGAELGRPDYLNYNKAYVQLNFDLKDPAHLQQKDPSQALVLSSSSTVDRLKYSAAVSATPLKRERWYMLSSPLRGVVSGDLSFGGFPLTFMMKFGPVVKDGSNVSVGSWTTTYTSLSEPVSGIEGFTFLMYEKGTIHGDEGCEEIGLYTDLNDNAYLPVPRLVEAYGLRMTNGILELPFFEDQTGILAHRIQAYNSLTKESTFFRIIHNTSNPSLNNRFNGETNRAIREANNGNYRFTPETYNSGAGRWEFPQIIYRPGTGIGGSDDILIGNPYMSSINMAAFLDDNNTTLLTNSYKIWNGSAFISYTRSGNMFIPTDGTSSYSHIAPMQGVFVTTVSAYAGAGNVAQFDVTKISTTRPAYESSNLRSETAEENLLRIKAENDRAASYMLIGYNENAGVGFVENLDVRRLFTPNDATTNLRFTEIYALADETPADVRYVNNKGEVVVPIGIRTNRTGAITLTFTGMNNYSKAKKIELYDAKENRTIDLTGKSSETYTFNNTESGFQNGRFSLRFDNSVTSLPDVISDILKVYGDSNGIYVVSSTSDPVEQVIVYSFLGRKLFESASGANYYPLQDAFANAPLIVKVITKNGMKTVKLNAVK
jgi:hypothetical protein